MLLHPVLAPVSSFPQPEVTLHSETCGTSVLVA